MAGPKHVPAEVNDQALRILGRPPQPGDFVTWDETSGSVEWWTVEVAAGAARKVLSDKGEGGDDALVALLRAVEKALLDAHIVTQSPLLPADATADLPTLKDMFERDASAVKVLLDIGTQEAEVAAWQWAERAGERRARITGAQGVLDPAWLEGWNRWREPERWQRRFAHVLAGVLWHGQVQAAVEAKRQEEGRRADRGLIPSMLYDVARPTQHLMRRGVATLEPGGQGALFAFHDRRMVTPAEIAELPGLDLETAETMARYGMGLLQKPIGFRTCVWHARTALEQYLENQQDPRRCPDPRRKEYPGWWPDRAQELGLTGRDAAVELRQAEFAMGALRFLLPGGRSVSLMAPPSETKPRGRGHPGSIIYIYGEGIMPGSMFDGAMAGKSVDARFARKLVPLFEPPTHGRPNEHGGQYALWFALMIDLRLRAQELFRNGGIELGDDEVLHLSKRSGLSVALVRKTLAFWVEAGFLASPEPGVYSLGTAQPAALRALTKAGKDEADGRAGGAASVAKPKVPGRKPRKRP